MSRARAGAGRTSIAALVARRAWSFGVGVRLARAAGTALSRQPPGGPVRWQRTNHRGDTVSLLEGPTLAMAGTLAAVAAPGIPGRVRLAAAVAGLSAGVLGTYDDLVGATDSKGLKGHLTALRRGELTSGGIKVAGIGSAGLVAGAMLRRRPVEAALAGGLIAGTANLFNLLDLRPGRALKAGLIVASPYALTPGAAGDLMAGPVGAAVAVLPDDLAERSMLGDAGANAFGALVGVGVAASASRRSLVAMLCAVTALTLLSERFSFTRVIESTPGLRELDALGRRPA